MKHAFFEQLDRATNFEALARGLYGDMKRVTDELWCKSPYDDTPADKFSINALDGRWKNHKTGEGGSFITLIRRTHPDSWREEWVKIIPAAASVLKTPDKNRADSNGKSEKSGDERKITFAESMAKGRRRQNLDDFKEFAEAYEVEKEFLYACGLWTHSGGRLGPQMRLHFPIVAPDTGEIVGIKMRCTTACLVSATGENLKSKNQGGTKAGLIGWDQLKKFPDLVVIVVEGEKDWIVASHDLVGRFVVITNSNGAGTWKMEWSKALAGRHVILCYDEDDAGNKGSRRAAASLVTHAASVRLAHLGTPDRDVFRWLRDGGPGLAALLAVLEAAEPFDPSKNPGEIDAFIKSHCQEEDAQPNDIADILYRCMSDNGAIFNQVDDRQAFCAWRGRVYNVDTHDNWWKALVYDYTGKDAGSSEGFRILRHLEMLAITKGKSVEATTWFARRPEAVYLPMYGAEQRMVEVSPRGIQIVPNGYQDIVLMPVAGVREARFLDDRVYDPVQAEQAWIKFVSLFNCESHYRALIEAMILAMPFYDWCETHPHIRFQGGTGSGKSFASKVITTLLYGQPENQGGDTMAALYRMAGSRMLLALDNLEDSNLLRSPETRDFLLRAASGMTRAKSAKESESATVAQRTNCWILSTGKSPIGVGYEDMEERLVVIPMGGNKHKGFLGTDEIKWVQDHRNLLYSYFLRRAKVTLQALLASEQRHILRRMPEDQRPRLHEWYSLLSVVHGDKERPGEMALSWLSGAFEGEKASVIESDPVIALLSRLPAFFADQNMARLFEAVEAKNNGAILEITAHPQVLHALFARVSRDMGLRYGIPSGKSLGYHLRSLARRSGEFGFHIQQRETQTRLEDTGQRSRAWYIGIHLDAVKALVPFSAIPDNNGSVEKNELPFTDPDTGEDRF